MIKSTFHSHSRYDDGQGELEAYVREAIDREFKVFGFSAHAPVIFDSDWNMKPEDFEDYIETAKALKEKYGSSIEIYTGLETDYYSGCIDWRRKKGVDYTIGAIHFLVDENTGEILPMDGTQEEFETSLANGFGGNIQALVEAYYGTVRDMLLKMPPNIVAHLDVIRKNNGNGIYFNEDHEFYREEVLKTLEIISLTNAVIEVNTGGMARGYMTEPYPSKWILEICYELDIPVMINSDCHHPDNIDYYYNEALNLLKSIGIHHQRILYGNEWRDVSL